MKKEEKLLGGSIPKVYLSYLVPTIIGMLTNSVYCMVDVMFVGKCLGSDALAAFNIAMPIYTIYSSIGLMLGVGGATTIMVLTGQGDKKNVDKVFTLTFVSSLAVGLFMSVMGLIFLRPFAIVLGAPPELVKDVMDYLFPLQIVAFLYILNCTMQVIIRADYNPKLVMAAAVVGNCMNIFFDWFFVSVMGWGLMGASAATALGPVTACTILSFHYICRKNVMKFNFDIFHKDLFQRIIKNGVGTFILEFSSGAVVFMFNFVLLRVSGNDAVAVYSIVSNIAYVGKGIFNGISQAAQPLISVNYGASNVKRVNKSLHTALTYAVVFSLLSFLFILIFPAPIVRFFLDGDHLLSVGVFASRVYFISFVFTGINTLLMYFFQSVESIKVTVLIAMLRGVIFILVGLLILPRFFGELGVWMTITFAEVMTMLIALPIKQKFNRLLQEKSNLAYGN